MKRDQQIGDGGRRFRVEIARGFVAKNQARLPDQRARNRRALLLTAGEFRRSMMQALTKANQFALIYRLNAVKRAETRERKIGEFVAMLARHETFYPQKAKPPTSP